MPNSQGPFAGVMGFDPTVVDVGLTAGAAIAAGGIAQIGPRYPLGTIMADRTGTSYMYVKNTGAAIAINTICGVDSDYLANPLTRALSAGGLGVVIPQIAIASGSTTTQFFWAFCGPGTGSALGISSTSASKALYTSASTGIAASVGTADYLLRGLKFTAATGSAGTAATACYADTLIYVAMTTNVAA